MQTLQCDNCFINHLKKMSDLNIFNLYSERKHSTDNAKMWKCKHFPQSINYINSKPPNTNIAHTVLFSIFILYYYASFSIVNIENVFANKSMHLETYAQ